MQQPFIYITNAAFRYSQTANPEKYKYVFTVAKDGTGDYMYIQDAIDAMRGFPLAPITLYIKNGVYNEKIELPSHKTDVSFIGESVEKTIITFNDYSGRGKLNHLRFFYSKDFWQPFYSREHHICKCGWAGWASCSIACGRR